MLLLQGNALLVGVGGSGKQSLAKLAAFMAGCEVFEITLTRGYDEVMFREDLKQLYTMIGADNKKVLGRNLQQNLVSTGALNAPAASFCQVHVIWLDVISYICRSCSCSPTFMWQTKASWS